MVVLVPLLLCALMALLWIEPFGDRGEGHGRPAWLVYGALVLTPLVLAAGIAAASRPDEATAEQPGRVEIVFGPCPDCGTSVAGLPATAVPCPVCGAQTRLPRDG